MRHWIIVIDDKEVYLFGNRMAVENAGFEIGDEIESGCYECFSDEYFGAKIILYDRCVIN